MFNLVNKTFSTACLFAAVLLLFTFTTCDTPMGLGDPIDWEPPVIELDPTENPKHVRLGTVITGTVTDNIVVDRVIMRDAGTGSEMFRAKLLPNNRFEIALNFDQADNNRKISVEIVAFDRIGNASAVNLTIIVDLRPPLVESAWIERAPGKIYWLESYPDLEDLENTDLFAERRDNMHRFQNGWFNFRAKLNENETRIDKVLLNIYDTRDLVNPVISEEMDTARGSLYSPFWLVKEEEILTNGAAIFGADYITNYRNNNARYYYYVTITALDRSENTGTLKDQMADQTDPQGFFAMWERADIPKGIIDTIIGNTIYKRQPIPVQVFDDDSLDFAYVGLLTRNQWYGNVSITGNLSPSNPTAGVNIPQAYSEEDKLVWLHDRLRNAGQDVFNWKLDPRYTHYTNNSSDTAAEKITERINGRNVDDILINLDTGSHDNDYGEFVLFTIVQDKKLAPHTGAGETDTLRPRWKGRAFHINIIDDNMPLIVFDTVDTTAADYQVNLHLGGVMHEGIALARTGNSPEENTFPRLDADGETFEINGYTLRENNSGQNSVQRFRMAWIPFSLLTSPAVERQLITQVENFLRWHGDPIEPNRQNLPINQLPDERIQYWVMDDAAYATANSITKHGNGIIKGTDQVLTSTNSQGNTTSTTYDKRVFRKKFNILGGQDDLRSDYRNFSVKNSVGEWVLENETKLFVFCTIDSMQKVVFRTIRLLPNRTPPELRVYDITARNMTLPTNVSGMPNNLTGGTVTSIPSPFFYAVDGTMTTNYRNARQTFNNAAYSVLKNASVNLQVGERTVPFQSYPRGTQLKYWVSAELSGDIRVQSIVMEDVTFSGDPVVLGSSFNQADRALSYVEWFPEVTQRVFRFTARDTLGNTAQIQRTIAITSGATLTSIESDRESGTYGMNQKITLRANFDGQIQARVTNNSGQLIPGAANLNNILLNVRYQKAGGEYVYKQLPCIEVETLSLVFEFTVEENDIGRLETAFDSPSFYDPSSFSAAGITRPELNRPITLINNTVIVDAIRNDTAFTPGNVTGFTWPNSNYSLQDPTNGKNIQLNGVRPRIVNAVISGKTPLTNAGLTEYYFKSGETISITLTGDKDIRNSGTPNLSFRLRTPLGGTTLANSVNFTYQRPQGATGLVFTLPVDNLAASLTAQLDQIALVSSSTIVDDFDNPVVTSTANDTNLAALLGTNTRIFIDRRPPPGLPLTPIAQAATLNGAAIPSNQRNFNFNPNLVIPNLATTDAAEPWAVTRQYSLNGGNTWIDFTGTVALTNGTHNLLVRYTDRAGNTGNAVGQEVVVNANFPRLNAINAVQPSSTYNSGSNLEFTLDFDDVVFIPTDITPAPVVSITLADLTQNTDATYGGVSPTFSITLNATAIAEANASQTVRFAWPDATGKDMLNGLRVTAMNLSGLRDTFGNVGPSTGMTFTSTVATMPQNNPSGTTYTTNYSLSGIIVNTIIPIIRSREPQTVQGRTTNSNITVFSNDPDAIPTGRASIANGSISADNRTIRLNFGKEIQKGNGTITIRPRGNYAIPPVFENDGYYLQVNLTNGVETRRTTKADGFTYVMGFADVFNNASTADKNILIGSANLSAPAVSLQTGLSSGRYLRTTHGLTSGLGLSGNYGNAATIDTGGTFPGTSNLTTPFLSGFHAPGPHIAGAMVPDLSLKWVLRYNIGNIHDATAGSDVSQIRSVLTNIKWRWQEIAVTSSDVTLINAGTVTNGTVEIKLPEPLLPGLQWDVYYTAGTFTDRAGNPVAAEGYTGTSTTMNATSNYWFWSAGVQTPVIRVDRKSFDARAGTNLTGAWNKSGWGGYNANGFNGAITDFNTIAYRIETETPGARIFYNTITGANNTGSATGDFTGVVNSTAFGSNNITTTDPVSWHGPRANVTTTARAATTFQYTSNAHGFGEAGTVLQVRVGAQDYWLRVVSGTTFRLYNTQAAASTTTAGNGEDAGQPITINGYQTTGRWVRPNMIFRNQSTVDINSATNATGHYNLLVNTSTTIPKYVNRVGNSSRYYGFRSYNKDALRSELDALGLTTTPTPAADGSALNASFTGYANFQASKNYVAAIARVNHNASGWTQTSFLYQSNRGFEGVFRTVIMINQSNRAIANNNSPMFLGGVTAINAIPTVPAFPVRDGVATIDARFVKAYHRNGTEFYWVSTEMVCEWYVQNFGWGAGGSYSRQGDWSDWITAGYGDLSHVYQLESW